MPEAVFFDLDKTISSVPTERFFAIHLFKKGIISAWDLILVIWHTLKYDLHITRDFCGIKRDIIRVVMRNQCALQMKAVYRSYFNDFLIPRIYPYMIEEIEKHRRQNRKLVIISASLDFIVEEFCRFLKIDHYYAANLEIIDEKYSGNTLGAIYMGRTKNEAVAEYARTHRIDLSRSYAYGDYIDDHHMLGMVGYPVAVNPDKKLLQKAIDNSWEILNCDLPA